MSTAAVTSRTLSLRELFTGRRFTLTFYQREYTWSRADVKALVSDLRRQFDLEWQDGGDDERVIAAYYLGSLVYYCEDATTYVIDGQQRLTTLCLLLLHVRALLIEQERDVSDIDAMLLPGPDRPTHALDVAEYLPLYQAMMDGRELVLRPGAGESERRLVARAADLVDDFPAGLAGEALAPFADWLLDRVCVVGIQAVDRDHGWRIFETTNDRGVRLGPTDLLKGYLLVEAATDQATLNAQWRGMVSDLAAIHARVPSEFLKAYLLATHVDLTDDEDQRQAAEAFHEWVRVNADRLGLRTPADFTRFLRDDLVRTGGRVLPIVRGAYQWDPQWAVVYYNEYNQVPYHLAAMLAATRTTDTDAEFAEKARLVARYLDQLYVRRYLTDAIEGASDLANEVLALIADLRTADSVPAVLAGALGNPQVDFRRVATLRQTSTNGSFVRFLLARLTEYADRCTGRADHFADYVGSPPYVVSHIWSDRYADHRDAGNAQNFANFRERLGALVLLPPGALPDENLPYAQKLSVYRGQNALAAALHPEAYADGALAAWAAGTGLTDVLQPSRTAFSQSALVDRQILLERLCNLVWDPAALGLRDKALVVADPPAATATATLSMLQAMIELKFVKAGQILVGYDGQTRHTATILEDGRVELSGPDPLICATPDIAARTILRKSANGWTFWHIEENAKLVSLESIRADGLRTGLLEPTPKSPPTPPQPKKSTGAKKAQPTPAAKAAKAVTKAAGRKKSARAKRKPGGGEPTADSR